MSSHQQNGTERIKQVYQVFPNILLQTEHTTAECSSHFFGIIFKNMFYFTLSTHFMILIACLKLKHIVDLSNKLFLDTLLPIECEQ